VAHLDRGKTRISARIVYWGIPGSGVTTNLRVIHSRLRPDHRGELQAIPTRLDPTASYEVLPIELGKVNGFSTQLQVVAVPGGTEHAPTRKQLLDRVDGLVLVIDSRPERAQANLASLAELRDALAAYGTPLEGLPVVVQYNRRDASAPFAIEDLHRKLAIPGAAVFEAVASQGQGVLQTLTTVSKQVVRVLRESQLGLDPALETEQAGDAPPVAEERELPAADLDLMENAILAEGEDAPSIAETEFVQRTIDSARETLDRPWDDVSDELDNASGARIGHDLEIVSVGEASLASQRSLEVPIVLGNREGETVRLRLTVALDPLLDSGEE